MEVDKEDMKLEATCNDSCSARQLLRNNMLDYLCKSKEAHFKSQQIGDPDLLDSEKRAIAESILARSSGTFLARFGSYLLEEHLEYFNDCSEDEQYEVDFYLKQLRASHNEVVSHVKIRNRRFEALKKLVNEGKYFSEYEMKKRNPLLYEQLIGQFLTEEEEKERTGIDTSNITFVNLLLEQYDRDQMKKLRQQQQEDEDNQIKYDDDDEADDDYKNRMNVDDFDEENDSDDEDCSDYQKCKLKTQNQSKKLHRKRYDTMDDDEDYDCESSINKSLWGEEMTEKSQPRTFCSSSQETNVKTISDDKRKRKVKKRDSVDEEEEDDENELTDEEKILLMEEFRSSMFNSFLEGKDADFDYHEVDENSDYDDIDMRDEDEQEKYFNSESPEDYKSEIKTIDDNNKCEMKTNGTASPVTILSSGVCIDINDENNDPINSDNVENHDDKDIDSYLTSLQTKTADSITNGLENLHH